MVKWSVLVHVRLSSCSSFVQGQKKRKRSRTLGSETPPLILNSRLSSHDPTRKRDPAPDSRRASCLRASDRTAGAPNRTKTDHLTPAGKQRRCSGSDIYFVLWMSSSSSHEKGGQLIIRTHILPNRFDPEMLSDMNPSSCQLDVMTPHGPLRAELLKNSKYSCIKGVSECIRRWPDENGWHVGQGALTGGSTDQLTLL